MSSQLLVGNYVMLPRYFLPKIVICSLKIGYNTIIIAFVMSDLN